MGQSVHTGVSHLLCRKGGNQHGIQDGNVRCDLKVCQRILDSLGVICDNGESSYLCGSSGCGGNGAEMRFRAQLREVKGNDQILEGGIRMLVKGPHCLGSINGGAAADGYDPVGLEFLHGLCAAHYGLYGRIRLNAFKESHFHAGFF